MTNFEEQRQKVLANLDVSHDAYYKAATFGGPSLHFHLRALQAGRSGDCEKFIEPTYAVLASWGMHRMGKGGSKMCDFSDFSKSIRSVWPMIRDLKQIQPADMDETHWGSLRNIFCGICCMRSATTLVGNSKVMAHALPQLIPPIDREYTMSFLFGRKTILNDLDWQWDRMKLLLTDFFYPLLHATAFANKAHTWMGQSEVFPWDTSELKIADNLVIGWKKHITPPKKKRKKK